MYRLMFIFVLGTIGATLLGRTSAASAKPASRSDSPEPTRQIALIPQPAQMEIRSGQFALTSETFLLVEEGNDGARAIGEYLAEWLRRGTCARFPLNATDADTPPRGAILLTTRAAGASLGDEGYELIIDPNSILLRAPRLRGLFWGVQTIRQLLPPQLEQGASADVSVRDISALPSVHIVDKPRYRWRGMLLDCCRHFMTTEFVKRYIDLLAYHRMNVLHWHLTEDQGWRIEIKKYPRLTEVGAWRGEGDDRYGGFYTQEDIRQIVAYAASRHVTIVPEIEMPGHALAALASYPELSCTGGPFHVGAHWGIYEDVYCAGNEKTFEFLENVLAEVIELFPSPCVHIGGDECPKKRWRDCPKCQARIAAEGLADEQELQSYFIRRIEKFLNGRNRRLIGWDEIIEGGLAPNATVQSWRGLGGAVKAARAGHDVICSPTSHCYLDYPHRPNPSLPDWMGTISLKKIYSFEPTPGQLTARQARRVLGAEGNIWTERAPQHRVDHQVFPRLCALAEVTWSPARLRNWDDFSSRMVRHYSRLDALGVDYYIPRPILATSETTPSGSVRVELANPSRRGEIRYTLNGSEPTRNSSGYVRPLELTAPATVRARIFWAPGHASDVASFDFVGDESNAADAR